MSESIKPPTTFLSDCNKGDYNASQREIPLPILDDGVDSLGILDPFCPWLVDMNIPFTDTGSSDATISVNTWMDNLFSGLNN